MGSTEKMGTGVNVQARAAALHHVDVPWRPCDLEQREGRILRQGNQNLDGIHIFNYVTEGSYDTVMWQKVQAKALFIEQMHRNEIVDTEIEDLSGGDIGAAAAETKAIATGDPVTCAKSNSTTPSNGSAPSTAPTPNRFATATGKSAC